MFTTEILFPKRHKPNIPPESRIKIQYQKLQSFYTQLLDDPIRPQIEDFLWLENKVDIQEKFDKYDQLQKNIRLNGSVSYTEDQKQNECQKYLIFRPPLRNSDINANKVTDKHLRSRISYFHIGSQLSLGLDRKSLNKKSFETKKFEKQTFQNLRAFLYEQEAIFFVIKGQIQLKRRFDDKVKEQGSNTVNPRQIVEQVLYKSTGSQLSQRYKKIPQFFESLHLLEENSKINQTQSEEQVKNSVEQTPLVFWKKHQQIKEHAFFSLINFKSLHNNQQVQYYKLEPKGQSLIAKLPINPEFGLQYLIKQEQKLKCLLKIFLNSDKSQSSKSQSFKLFFDSFQEQYIKKQMSICAEGKPDETLYVLANDQQVQLTKRILFKENSNVEGSKSLKVCSIKGPAFINAQYFLKESKTVLNLFKSNSFKKRTQTDNSNSDSQNQEPLNKSSKIQKIKNVKQSSKRIEQPHQQKDVQGLQRKLMLKRNKRSQSQMSSFFNGDQVLFGRDQKSYFKFYLPQYNVSNFTAKTNSAYLKVYSISLNKFLGIAPERFKMKLCSSYEEFYIHFLRKANQKLQLFEKEILISTQKKNLQLKKYAALASIQQLNRFSPEFKNQLHVNVSIAKLEFQNKKQFKGLKRNDLVYRESQILEKKMQMIKQKNTEQQPKQALTKNFKKKIENLIVQNLKNINMLTVEKEIQELKTFPIVQIKNFYTQNLVKILDSQKTNPSQKYHKLLDRKQTRSVQSLNKSQEKQQFKIQRQMYVNPDCFDPKKNKNVKINFLRKGHPCVKQKKNYLKGMQIDNYTDAIKSHVSVKINQTNKIKEQFIRIESKCESCKCYQNLESYRNLSTYHSQRTRPFTEHQRHSSHDIKYHTMKIGVSWKTKTSGMGKVESKTAYNQKGLQKKLTQMAQDDQPFEKVYNRIKILKQKSLEKFNFNEHLQKRGQMIRTRKSRKKSAPLLL